MILNYSATTVTLPANLFNNPMPIIEHSQNVHDAEDGTVYAYNRAVNRWYYKVKVRLSESQRSALRAFVRNTIQFGTLAFSVTPDAAIDAGKGAGTQLTNVRWWEDSYSEIPTAPGRWEVSFTLRTSSTGTSNPA